MEIKELTCIRCPIGCQITVELEGGEVTKITGNSCPRGAEYASNEVTNPTRIVTSSVRVEGGERPVVSVKTAQDVPKSKIFDVANALGSVVLKAPVKIGDIALTDVAGTGVDMVVTAAVDAVE